MSKIILSKVPFGTNVAGVNHLVTTHPDAAASLVVAFTEDESYPLSVDTKPIYQIGYVRVSGIPLSVSSRYSNLQLLQYEKELSVEKRKCGQYYTLDVIAIPSNLDVIAPDATDTSSFMKPSTASFGFSGVRMANVKIDKKYYLNVIDNSVNPLPYDKTVICGVPMLICNNGQLMLNKTAFSLSDINTKKIYQDVEGVPTLVDTGIPELVKITIGGLPLTAGRIGTKYYLIVYTSEFSSSLPLSPEKLYVALTEGDFYGFDQLNSLLDGDFESEFIIN